MTKPLIPLDLLQRSPKILFIAHLAIGDFTYLQNCFQAFAQAFPHCRVDLWVDEVRRTRDASQWPHLKKYSLYDWLAECPFFNKIYNRTYSPQLYQESIIEAKREDYPIVVSLATLRPAQYATLARTIAGNGFVVGMKAKIRFFQLNRLFAYRKLDAVIASYKIEEGGHVSDAYANWFYQLCGIKIAPEKRFPFVTIPDQWLRGADKRIAAWRWNESDRLIFINPYAKTKKRCWPLESVAKLIFAMQRQQSLRNVRFIVNAAPNELTNARRALASYGLEQSQLFSAEENFFELPALLKKCCLIISVETAVMHLANAVHVPVLALMRQKTPEWAPLDRANSLIIFTAHRRDWVRAIKVEQVMAKISGLEDVITEQPTRKIFG